MTGESRETTPAGVPPSSDLSAPALVAVTREDVLGGERLLRRPLDLLRLDRPRGWLWLTVLIVVPLALFVGVTSWEGRFWFGSVTSAPKAELGGRVVRGMSFVGDTMVWPYVILIPLLFALLDKAIGRFERLFTAIRPVLTRRWLADHDAAYREIVERTRRIAAGGGNWRYVRRLALAIGLVFFAWNTVTCSFPDTFEPYKTSAPWVDLGGQGHTGSRWLFGARVGQAGGADRYVQMTLEAPVQVPKWDTDPENGRWSWLLTRLWVLLLGYVWIPLAIYKLVNLTAATYHFTGRLAAHGALDVRPLAPDGAGGLGSLAALSLALTYPLVVLGTMLAMPFFKENTSASLHDLVLFVPFVPVFFAMFFVPLLAVHRAMKTAKEEYQQGLADLCEEVHEAFLREVRTPTAADGKELSRLQLAMKGLSESLERARAMPVWPFQMSTVYRLITAGLLPVVVPWLINFALGQLLNN